MILLTGVNCTHGDRRHQALVDLPPFEPLVIKPTSIFSEIRLFPKQVPQGGVVFIQTELRSDESARQRVFLKSAQTEFRLFPREQRATSASSRYDAWIPIEATLEPGIHRYELCLEVQKGQTPSCHSLELQVLSGNFPSERLTVEPKKVEPPRRYIKRIIREVNLLKGIYAQSIAQRFWSQPWQQPLESDITSVYGSSRVYNNVKANLHYGTDFRAREGTPLVAPAPGKVVLAKDLYFTGNTVILGFGQDVFTVCAHLSRLSVREGDQVIQGQLLGLSGKTGRASGPHLHWGLQVQGIKVNPLFFKIMTNEIARLGW